MPRLALPTVLLTLVLCTPACAGTVTVGTDGVARYLAAPGELNTLTITDTATTLVVRDAVSGVSPADPSCIAVNAHTVRCRLAGAVDVRLEDGDDHVTSEVPGRFDGGAGADRMTGSAGADHLIGGAGRDGLDGVAGNDVVEGQTGYDFVVGGPGDDLVTGGAGRDIVVGNTIRGTGPDGADDLRGDAGNDILSGGPETDTLACGGGARDVAIVLGSDRADEGDCERYSSGGVCIDARHVRRVDDRIVLSNPCEKGNPAGRTVRLRGVGGRRLATGVAERGRVVLHLTRLGRRRLRPGRSVVVRLLVWPTDQPPPAEAPRVVVTL
jgi:Ca2+-binding RTX toxin-like protein